MGASILVCVGDMCDGGSQTNKLNFCAQTAFELEPDCNVVRQAGERVQGKPRRKEQNTRAPVFEPEPNTRPCLGSK